MGRKPKSEIVAELRARGIEVGENAKYWDLFKLWKKPPKKGSDPMPDLPVIEDRRLTHASVRFRLPDDLIKRAKAIGFTDEQIGTYTDPAKLEQACDLIKPQATVHLPPKKRQIFRAWKGPPKGKPAQATCISTITVLRAEHLVRAGYDDSNLGVFLRQNRIRPETIQRVIITRDYIPDKRDILTTTFVIEYLKKG